MMFSSMSSYLETKSNYFGHVDASQKSPQKLGGPRTKNRGYKAHENWIYGQDNDFFPLVFY